MSLRDLHGDQDPPPDQVRTGIESVAKMVVGWMQRPQEANR